MIWNFFGANFSMKILKKVGPKNTKIFTSITLPKERRKEEGQEEKRRKKKKEEVKAKTEMTLPIQKSRACVVVGSSFSVENDLLDQIEKVVLSTPFGEGEIYKHTDCDSFIQFRHGLPHRLLPNQINWRAQAWMWKELNIDVLLLTSSVGVMDASLPLFTPLIASDLLMPFNQLPDGTACSMFAKPHSDHGHLLLQDGIFNSQFNTYLKEKLSTGGIEAK